MNDEQGNRLNKVLKIIGYIISGVVVWIYGTKGIVILLPTNHLVQEQIGELSFIVAIAWPVFGALIANGSYHLYTWIRTGKSKSLFDRRTDEERGADVDG